ncbi:MAG: archaemetzincin family Zn-dependent metalloprotease [Candidatus Omnitrophica bacterium]|nr:archaemetzincin family Zn-dependent metalloprotease [Candidatus Omnitrophota bacterium]MDD5573616.1 archaemetzincin family Zn-dependent metalloprotease [Candidatus Omnitrophota bacterium]
MKIFLIPIGMPRHEVFDRLAAGLARSFSADVAIEPKRPIPEEAYDFRRRQYYANAILDDLAGEFIINTKEERVLGVMDADMHTDPMNFIFGLANRRTGCCLLSLARLKPEFYGRKQDKELFYSRAIKESIHELGHTLRLSHCSHRRCAMFFSDSVNDTDAKKAAFCAACKRKISARKS